ncbi:MAG: hypothetical protein ACFB6S_07970 [Geminicoccaceae bacterium]
MTDPRAQEEDDAIGTIRPAQLPTRSPVRRAVRRMRWFRQSFQDQIDHVEKQTGIGFTVNRAKLTEAFLSWLRAFEVNRAYAQRDRKEFTYFCAGLMLRELVRCQPLAVETMPEVGADQAGDPVWYWPEGFVYVSYCLTVASAVLDQDFDERISLNPKINDVQTWWAFKENTAEAPSLAIPFLDLFMGLRPSWEFPDMVEARRSATRLIASEDATLAKRPRLS